MKVKKKVAEARERGSTFPSPILPASMEDSMYSLSSLDILGWVAGELYARNIQAINHKMPAAPVKEQ